MTAPDLATPRTDAEMAKLSAVFLTKGPGAAYDTETWFAHNEEVAQNLPDFARQFERENAALVVELEQHRSGAVKTEQRRYIAELEAALALARQS